MGKGKTIKLVDVTLRDAHQCLWATRMTTAMMAELAPRLDRAGFEAIDLVGGAVFLYRRAQHTQKEIYSDAGGMLSLNIEDLNAPRPPTKLIRSGEE